MDQSIRDSTFVCKKNPRQSHSPKSRLLPEVDLCSVMCHRLVTTVADIEDATRKACQNHSSRKMHEKRSGKSAPTRASHQEERKHNERTEDPRNLQGSLLSL